jgi:hypothetical protein
MKTISFHFAGEDLTIKTSAYRDNGALAVIAESVCGEPYAILSVNLDIPAAEPRPAAGAAPTTRPPAATCSASAAGSSVKLNQGAKPVPPEIVDRGCAFYERAKRAPMVPHYHHCRAASERHRWECRKRTLRLEPARRLQRRARFAAPNKETIMTIKLPKPRYEVTDDNHKYTIAMPDGSRRSGRSSPSPRPQRPRQARAQGLGRPHGAGLLQEGDPPPRARGAQRRRSSRSPRTPQKAHTVFAKDAADLGSACHDAFEAIILGKELETYPPSSRSRSPPSRTGAWAGSDIEIVDTETRRRLAEHKAGGRLDAIGYSESRGGWGIVDYKTSSGFYGNEYAYQVGGGYALMVEEMFGIEVKWGEIIRFGKKPPYDSEGRPVAGMAEAKQGFLHALTCALQRAQAHRRALVRQHRQARRAVAARAQEGQGRARPVLEAPKTRRKKMTTETQEAPTEAPKFTLAPPRKAPRKGMPTKGRSSFTGLPKSGKNTLALSIPGSDLLETEQLGSEHLDGWVQEIADLDTFRAAFRARSTSRSAADRHLDASTS